MISQLRRLAGSGRPISELRAAPPGVSAFGFEDGRVAGLLSYERRDLHVCS